MKPSLTLIALAASLVASPLLAGDRSDRGEAELAEILDGRVAGEPVRCLRTAQRDGLQIIDDTAFVFRDGKTLYVNRTSSPRFLDEFDVPVFKLFGSRLCRRDLVQLRDRFGFIGGPTVFLEEFIPYTKPEAAS